MLLCIDFISSLAQYIKMIEWEEKYSVGLSIIYEEHKELIRIMNAAVEAKQHNDNIDEISKLLKQLENRVVK